MKKLFVLSALLALATGVEAQTAVPDAIALPDVEINLSNAEITAKEIKFPALKRVKGYVPVLRAAIYFKTLRPSGWTPCGIMKLNGKPFGAETASKHARLLRRGKFMLCKFGGKINKVPYYRENKLLVMFAPGKENVLDARIVSHREEGCRYYFDISDLVSFAPGKENTLLLGSVLKLKVMKNRNIPLNFRNMKIMYVKEAEVVKNRK